MFELIDYVVKINPSSINIPEFQQIWKRDKVKGKKKAHAELSFVYYMCDYKSEYRNYPYDERKEKVIGDFMSKAFDGHWKPDAVVNSAMEKYESMQQTPSLRYLNSVEGVINKMTDFNNSVQSIDEDSMKVIADSIDKTNKIILSLPKIKEAVKKEVTEKERLRGGGEVGLYED